TESKDFTVTYHPSSANAANGAIHIASNDPAQPTVDYPLTGSGTMVVMPGMCMPQMPDPMEPTNDTCMGAVDRGSMNLPMDSTQHRMWIDQMLYPAMDS